MMGRRESESEPFELELTDLSRGGAAVGRDKEGRVVFVPLGAPGDLVRVRAVAVKKNYVQAELLAILRPSANRIPPKCAVFGVCGGCEWQHLPYPFQWKTKVSGAQHALERTGVQLSNTPVGLYPADSIWSYRNRVQLRGEKGALGFYRRRSKDLVPIERCEIAHEAINASFTELRKQALDFERPYKVEVEVTEDGTVRSSWNARHAAMGFRQVHDEQNEKLKTFVKGHVIEGSQVLDLFGGSGNLSLGLLDRVRSVDCVDVSVPDQGPDRFRPHRSEVDPWLKRFLRQTEFTRPLMVIVDPPREGLGERSKSIVESLGKLRPERLISIGCEADPWARDLFRILQTGFFTLDKIAIFDLFPHTHHVECAAVLSALRQ